MKRLLLLFIAIAAVLLLGLPGYVGWQTEQRYRELIGTPGAPVGLVAFDRGWFHSRATLVVNPAQWNWEALQGLPSEEAALQLTDHIAHGPIPWAAGTDTIAQGPALVVVATRAGGFPLRSEYRLGLDGDLTGTVAWGGGRVPWPGDKAASLDSGSADWRVGGDGQSLKLALVAEGLALDAARYRLESPHLQFELRAARAEPGPWLADANSRLGELRLSDGRGPGFRVRGVAFDLGSGLQDDRFNGRLTVGVDHAAGPNHEYGPGRLELTLERLDADSLARLQATAMRFAGATRYDMAMLGAVYAELPRLLAHQPRLALRELFLQAPEGRLSARGQLALDTDDPTVLNNPYLLRQAVGGELHLSAPPALAERLARLYLAHRAGTPPPGEARQWLARQIERGTLERDEGVIRIHVRYASGRLTLNGRPWPAASGSAP